MIMALDKDLEDAVYKAVLSGEKNALRIARVAAERQQVVEEQKALMRNALENFIDSWDGASTPGEDLRMESVAADLFGVPDGRGLCENLGVEPLAAPYMWSSARAERVLDE